MASEEQKALDGGGGEDQYDEKFFNKLPGGGQPGPGGNLAVHGQYSFQEGGMDSFKEASFRADEPMFTGGTKDDNNEFGMKGGGLSAGFQSGGGINLKNLNLGSNKEQLFQTNTIPFYGRDKELATMEKAGERISLEWMENPSEVIWLSGPAGIGKSTLLKQAASQCFWKAFTIKSSCEQHRMALKPYKGLGDCLNELCHKLMGSGGKQMWKLRLEEALGGEGPLLATICPHLCKLMDIQPMDRKRLQSFDANTHLRFKRLLFAVKDFLQAVSEYHPLVVIIDNIQWIDLDSLQLIYELLASEILLNFLFIGAYDTLADDATNKKKEKKEGDDNDGEEEKQEVGSEDYENILEDDKNEYVDPNDSLAVLRKGIKDATSIRVTHVDLSAFSKQEVEEMLSSIFLEDGAVGDDSEVDKIQDLADILFALSKGNTLWMMQVLRLLNDLKLVKYDDKFFRWEWNRKKIKKEVKSWREANDPAFSSIEGVITKRLEILPNKIKFVVQVMADLGLSFFKVQNLYPIIAAGYTKETKDDTEECKIKDQEEFEMFVNKACSQGIMTRLQKKGYYKFSHDLIRQLAYDKLHPDGEKGLMVHLRMGGELSQLAIASKPGSEERERNKFGASDQLNRHMAVIEITQKAKLAKLNLEAAEIAMNKTAFRTAIEYLERGVQVLNFEARWDQQYYDVTLRTFLFLGRMRLCCNRLDSAAAACEEIIRSAANLKDKLYANQTLCFALQEEGKYNEALARIIGVLQKMGEQFPKDNVPEIIEREVNNLRKAIAQKNNQDLLNPPRMNDKKSLDIMLLFAHLIEICHIIKPDFIPELVMIRMMHLSLRWGFSRQYPLSFSLFAVALSKRGLLKEAHRMGQVGEKLARLGDFYGGEAVCLFHWHVGHWRRTYKRSLEPVLEIYNAQVDSGDFHHVGFSITAYVQYHLASGFDLERLSDNLELFDGLFADYSLTDDWQIRIPYQVVANLLGETANPLLFFGETIEQQNLQLQEMIDAGMQRALDYFYFMRTYVAFFFHQYDIMEECLEIMKTPSEGVWIPWAVFFDCYLLIQTVYDAKGTKKKRKLLEEIDIKQEKLVDWYNEGNPNASTMISILEAEYVCAKEAGSKSLSSLKVQGLYDEAIEAAAKDGVTNLEAFAAERAGLHFHKAGVEKFAADYLAKAHSGYETWNAIAKVIDIEDKFGNMLQISKRRQRVAAAFIDHNRSMVPTGRRMRSKDIKTIDLIRTAKNVKKMGKKGMKGVTKSKRKVKDIFKQKKRHGEHPHSPSRQQQQSTRGGFQQSPGGYSRSPDDSAGGKSPTKPFSSRLFGKTRPPLDEGVESQVKKSKDKKKKKKDKK